MTMTPDERARADAINDALTASLQKRQAQSQQPSAADCIREPKGKGVFYYGGIVAFVVALHVAGAFAYGSWQKKQTAGKETARLAEMESRRLREEVAHAEFMRQQVERDAQRARIQQSGQGAIRTVAGSATPTRVEYNVMPTPPSPRATQQPARQVRLQVAQPQAPEAPAPAFTQADHANLILQQARTYFNSDDYAKHLGVMNTWVERIGIESTFHDTFWNKYVTVGEVTVHYTVRNPGGSYTRTLKFEGETNIKDGRLQISSNVRPK